MLTRSWASTSDDVAKPESLLEPQHLLPRLRLCTSRASDSAFIGGLVAAIQHSVSCTVVLYFPVTQTIASDEWPLSIVSL